MLSREQIRASYPVVYTEHLVLRKITSEDERDLYNLITNPAVYPHLGIDTSTALFPSRLYRHFEEANQTLSAIHFGITFQPDPRLIGICSLQKWDHKKGTATIGYCVSPAYWNKGLATEAVRAVIGFGIRELGIRQIRGRCEENNVASCRVMENCGLTREFQDSEDQIQKLRFPGLISFVLKVNN